MNLEHRKFLRPNDVEAVDGIKVGTLAKQRNQGNGLPYVVIGRAPKKRKGGIILYDKEAIEEVLKSKNKVDVA